MLGNIKAKCPPAPGEEALHRSRLISGHFPVTPFPGSRADASHSVMGRYKALLWQAEWEGTDGT